MSTGANDLRKITPLAVIDDKLVPSVCFVIPWCLINVTIFDSDALYYQIHIDKGAIMRSRHRHTIPGLLLAVLLALSGFVFWSTIHAALPLSAAERLKLAWGRAGAIGRYH